MKKAKLFIVQLTTILLVLSIIYVPHPISALVPFAYPIATTVLSEVMVFDTQEDEYTEVTSVVFGTFSVGRDIPDNPEDAMNDMYTYASVWAYGDGYVYLYDGQNSSQEDWVYTYSFKVCLFEILSHTDRLLASDENLELAKNEPIEASYSMYDLTLPIRGEIYIQSCSYFHYDESHSEILHSSNGFCVADGEYDLYGWTRYYNGAAWFDPSET